GWGGVCCKGRRGQEDQACGGELGELEAPYKTWSEACSDIPCPPRPRRPRRAQRIPCLQVQCRPTRWPCPCSYRQGHSRRACRRINDAYQVPDRGSQAGEPITVPVTVPAAGGITVTTHIRKRRRDDAGFLHPLRSSYPTHPCYQAQVLRHA